MSADNREVERRVINWARWLSGAGGAPGTCASAERMYVPPRIDEDERERKAIEPVDPLDAELVEGLMTKLQRRTRKFLTEFYYHRKDLKHVSRVMHLDPNMMEAYKLRALQAIGAEMERDAEGANIIKRGALHWAGVAKRDKPGYFATTDSTPSKSMLSPHQAIAWCGVRKRNMKEPA